MASVYPLSDSTRREDNDQVVLNLTTAAKTFETMTEVAGSSATEYILELAEAGEGIPIVGAVFTLVNKIIKAVIDVKAAKASCQLIQKRCKSLFPALGQILSAFNKQTQKGDPSQLSALHSVHDVLNNMLQLVKGYQGKHFSEGGQNNHSGL